jgi:hypothetical protein
MILFSVEQNKVSKVENIQANEEVADILTSKQVGIGVYNGIEEVCYLTRDNNTAKMLCAEFKQDCYLERGHYGYWYLIETTTGKVLDTFKTIKEVSKERAMKSNCYTMMNGNYYLGSHY